jgi:hypothetical protein
MQNKIQLSFKFSEFYLNVEHKHISDIGKFAIFCLRAFRDCFSINDISSITNVNENVIKKQLIFLQEQKYISEEYEILENAIIVLNIFDFLNNIPNNQIVICLEHYIWNKDNKEFFTFDSSSQDISMEAKGTVIKPIVGSYKISSILEELKPSNRYMNLLIKLFPKYETLINENTDGFAFNISSTNKSFYLNKNIQTNQIIKLKHEVDSTIKIGIPYTEYKTSLKDHVNCDKGEYNWYNENKSMLNCSICCLSGNMINNEMTDKLDDSKLTLLPKATLGETILDEKIQIPVKLILKKKLSINKSESYYLKSLNDENVNSYIKM